MILTMLVALNGLFFYHKYKSKSFACSSDKISGNASIGGNFELVDENGSLVTNSEVIDMPVLVYFGYTFCPDICPIDSMRNAEVTESLHEKGINIKPIFITIDPERDTPKVLKEFTDVMHPEMLGLTGSLEQIKAVSQAYKTYYKKQVSDDEYYLVDHSTFTYFLTPKNGFVDFFRREDTVEKISETIECYLRKT
jgi:protein SCO1/2